jgi:SAM-dependent methyltransferase
MEYVSFGRALERCRFAQLPSLLEARQALVYGDGDGRFLELLLQCNPGIHVDVVDSSAAMLALARARVLRVGAGDRVRFFQTDALRFSPPEQYDLVVTHFFLDCFDEAELEILLQRVRPHVRAGALWLVSEFAIPRGWAEMPSRALITGLYGAFALLTGLRTRSLPDYAGLLRQAGFARRCERSWLHGLLRSEIWTLQA